MIQIGECMQINRGKTIYMFELYRLRHGPKEIYSIPETNKREVKPKGILFCYVVIYIHLCMYIYIYIYRERDISTYYIMV